MLIQKSEILNLSKLRGTSHVLQIHSVLVGQYSLIILTEYIDQHTLKLPVSDCSLSFRKSARRIFKELLRAVLKCHRKKIVHRDIQLENVLYGADRGIVLIDFGLSVDLSQIGLGRKLDTAGTPAYMAPELFSHSSFRGEQFCIFEILCKQYDFKLVATNNRPSNII